MNRILKISLLLSLFLHIQFSQLTFGQEALSPHDLLSLKSCSAIQISPNGKQLLYALNIPRTPNEAPGNSHSSYHLLNLKDNTTINLFEKEMNVHSPKISPDGKYIAFLYSKKKDDPKQIWAMPLSGGNMIKMTSSETGILTFKWNPLGNSIAYLAPTPKSDKEKELKKRGYGFIFFEENLKNNNLFITKLNSGLSAIESKQITERINVWDFEFNKQGTRIAFSASEKKLIDHKYMFRKIHVIVPESGTIEHKLKNVGKLGNYSFSPDGKNLAYTGALNINDHSVSQAYVYSFESKRTQNLTPEGLIGHIKWINWKNNSELIYLSEEGVYPKLNHVSLNNNERKVILDAKETGVIFQHPVNHPGFEKLIFNGSTPKNAKDIYTLTKKGTLIQLTNINPQLEKTQLGEQVVFRYPARDGMEIEGILIKPVGYKEDRKYPLIVYVHGGPEAHHSNGWLSRYSTPGQVMAGKGYMVAYLNYRASTGYGVDFGMEGFMDPAGKEFDDIADAIDFLCKEKGADKERVGLAGGSYGGYASAWFSTYYTKYVKAVCMFVGISNVISKRGTTDIPYEEMYVHSGKPLEEQWQMNLERSPVYWAHQSKTATLIYGGANDTRVHPTQSIELFRRMKMNNHPAVRLVQYPGEGHGNRMQVGRIDVLMRQADWFDWYVKGSKPLNGPMPPLDISDKYGLDWNF